MKTISPDTSCWIITEGMAGTENQCIGVAEALGLRPDIKRIGLKQPWRTLSPYLGFEKSWSFSLPLTPPWPDLLITSGRKSIAASRFIRRASGGKTFTVHIQDPRIDPRHFDLLAVPRHDPTRGDNVIVTTANPNRITPARLDEARQNFAQFEKLPAPRVAVLIGGTSKAYKMTAPIIETLAEQLQSLKAGLMITTSRRTGEANTALLKDALEGHNHFFWDGAGENPYFAMLGWADFILVTADSTAMLSEAATTGKPVYMIDMKGGGKRLRALHENLVEHGAVRIFEGELERWSYTPLNDATTIAAAIRDRISK